jgi:hypothetical protein
MMPAAWNAGDLGGDLGGALGEQLVELLDRHAGGLAEDAYGGAGALGLVLGAHEPDDLPVPGVSSAMPSDLAI